MWKPEETFETEWTRVQRDGPRSFAYLSKFLIDGIKVSAAEIRRRWESFSPAERLDFAQSFAWKGKVGAEDESILLFLMEVGSASIWAAIAPLVPKLHDRDRALNFLLKCIEADHPADANFYQALEKLADPRSLPALRNRYEDYVRRLKPLEEPGFRSELTSYQSCCLALWNLDGSPKYEAALRTLLDHPDESVRRSTQRIIAEKKIDDKGATASRASQTAATGGSEADELIHETEWSRFYRHKSGSIRRYSKFQLDGLEVSAASIHERWDRMPLEDQVEFAQAFSAKPAFTQDDLSIMRVMVEDSVEYVRTTLGINLRRHAERERVLTFFRECAASEETRKLGTVRFGNYYQLFVDFSDAAAAPLLREHYGEYQSSLQPLGTRSLGELQDYLRCCYALWIVDGSQDYFNAVREMDSHPLPAVRRAARDLLP